jgi:hypothetical protein
MGVTMGLFNAVTELTVRTTDTQVAAITIRLVRITPVVRIHKFAVVMPS